MSSIFDVRLSRDDCAWELFANVERIRRALRFDRVCRALVHRLDSLAL
jgi:hypothetical protein